jgi:putative YphP/YqiW family bacilliredoxin
MTSSDEKVKSNWRINNNADVSGNHGHSHARGIDAVGIVELRTADEVDQAIKKTAGTAMVVVNSICGCAAGRMRPAVRVAMQNSVRPDKAYSVFAGQDTEATERARSYFTGQPPSSPSIAILRDGELVYMMPRRDIESREAPAIAADLKAAFDKLCAKSAAV